MKKILIGTSALVAAGMIVAPGAMAAEKIKLGLGGFMKAYAGYATQEDSYETATSTSYSRFDVKQDSEIYIQGSTKLDNGLTVGMQVQMETDKSNGNGAIDWSYLYLTSASMGRLAIGNVGDSASQMMHNAPEAGNSVNWGVTASVREWVAKPANVVTFAFPFDAEDDAGVTYITPSFAGFKAGVSYTPDTAATSHATIGTPDHSSGGQDSKIGASVAYDAKFDGVSIGADVARWKYDDNSATQNSDASSTQTRFGLNVGFAGFTVGGSYMKSSTKNPTTVSNVMLTNNIDGKIWEVGARYATGPYGISLSYLKSDAEGTASATTSANDTLKILNLGGSYAMGPGVTALGSIASVKYQDETTTLANNNEGWTAHAGISLAF